MGKKSTDPFFLGNTKTKAIHFLGGWGPKKQKRSENIPFNLRI
jgi:hypothetical protein